MHLSYNYTHDVIMTLCKHASILQLYSSYNQDAVNIFTTIIIIMI